MLQLLFLLNKRAGDTTEDERREACLAMTGSSTGPFLILLNRLADREPDVLIGKLLSTPTADELFWRAVGE